MQPVQVSVEYDSDLDGSDLVRAARWTATSSRPPTGWMEPGFDDRAWQPPRLTTADECRDLSEWERRPFALETPELWVRVVFDVALTMVNV